jgi:hypothetical protein
MTRKSNARLARERNLVSGRLVVKRPVEDEQHQQLQSLKHQLQCRDEEFEQLKSQQNESFNEIKKQKIQIDTQQKLLLEFSNMPSTNTILGVKPRFFYVILTKYFLDTKEIGKINFET